jgi:L-glutamine-phosphate cytidylyltransferase
VPIEIAGLLSMKAVILAAGRGSRLGAITENTPKPLVKVAGRACLDIVCDALEPVASEIIIVTGFLSAQIEAHIAKRSSPIPIKICRNPAPEAGNLSSVETARAAIGEAAFILTNADHLFPSHFYSDAFKSGDGVRIACERDRVIAHDEMKVQVSGQSLCTISKTLPTFDGAYIGTTQVAANAANAYWNAFDTVSAHYDPKIACAEHVLGYLAQTSTTAPQVQWITGIRWYEVDTPEDHAIAEAGLRGA